MRQGLSHADRLRLSCDRSGARHAVPHVVRFRVNAKGRWVGKPLADVLATEFSTPPAVIKTAIAEERITVNGFTTRPDYCVRDHDVVVHETVVREPPVRSDPIRIVARRTVEGPSGAEPFIAVSKPPTIPVHPVGAFVNNTLVKILQLESGLGELHPLHRIDRLTSGLLLLADGGLPGPLLKVALAKETTAKIYLTRLCGAWGVEERPVLSCRAEAAAAVAIKAAGASAAVEEASSDTDDDREEDEPMWCGPVNEELLAEFRSSAVCDLARYATSLSLAAPTRGDRDFRHEADTSVEAAAASASASSVPEDVSAARSVLLVTAPIKLTRVGGAQLASCHPEGKRCASAFVPLAYDSATCTTLAAVRIFTGRTHQIRCHAQWLGLPVCGDAIYHIPPRTRVTTATTTPRTDETDVDTEEETAATLKDEPVVRNARGIALHSLAIISPTLGRLIDEQVPEWAQRFAKDDVIRIVMDGVECLLDPALASRAMSTMTGHE